jgi:hypothetical protein
VWQFTFSDELSIDGIVSCTLGAGAAALCEFRSGWGLSQPFRLKSNELDVKSGKKVHVLHQKAMSIICKIFASTFRGARNVAGSFVAGWYLIPSFELYIELLYNA